MRPETEQVALNGAYHYTDQPVNWGEADPLKRAAERDAFVSGFEAGMKHALALVEGAAS